MEDGAARCRCPPSRCSTHDATPVCGTDHTDYTSHCDMRAASCRLQRHIGKLYDGHCDKCREKQCDFHSECVTDSQGTATCVCPTESSCPQGDASSPLCGSDGQFYWTECEMEVVSCRLRQHIEPVDSQYCADPCYRVNCSGRGQQCVDGRCVCRRRVCPTNYDPVCGSDSVTYPNQCTLDLIACTERRDVHTLHRGVCKDEFMGSGFEDWQIVPPSGSDDDQVLTDVKTTTKSTTTTTRATTTTENGRCGDSVCQYGAVCVSDDRGRRQRCVCRFSCDAVRSAVCGSDGQLYASECLMLEQSCRRQTHIAVAPIDNCEEENMEVEMCDGQDPLVNAVTGRQFNCDDESCPSGSYCHRLAHQPSRCCLGDDGVSVVTSCDVTEYGCCPDGVTAALGRHHAGCPSKCRCNSLGSLASTCDAETGQCRCKRGVGGLRCDRCQPSYWGLQLAASSDNRNAAGGCIPCGCNMYGSIRDDCDQMTGQCRCRPLVSGHKCHQCADGATVGPNGCQLPPPPGVELKDAPAAAAAASSAVTSRDECSADKCRHGAVCDEKDGGTTQCVCPYDCSASRGPAVCATDGRRYASLCHLLRRACRRQQRIRQSLADRC